MILPLLDRRYNQTPPIATYALVALNLLVFLAVRPAAPEYLATVQRFGLSRVNLASIPLVTHMFLHAEPLHIIGNMLALWFFGRNLERIMGTPVFAPFYFASGVIAGLAQVGLSPRADLPLIGASGAIYGVIAGYVIFFPMRKVKAVYLLSLFSSAETALLEISAWVYVVLFVLFQDIVLFAVARGSDMTGHWAHFSGFAFGAGVTGLMRIIGFRGAPEEIVQETQERRYEARRVTPAPRPQMVRKQVVTADQSGRWVEEDRVNLTSIILLEEEGISPECLETLQRHFPHIALNPRYSLASNVPEQDALRLSRMLSSAGARHFVLPQEYVIHPPRVSVVVAVENTPENAVIFTDEAGNKLHRTSTDIRMFCAACILSEESENHTQTGSSQAPADAHDRYVLDIYASNPWVCYRMTGSGGLAPAALRSAASVLVSALPDVPGAETLRSLLAEEEFSGKRFKTLQEYERWAAWQLQLTQLHRMKRRERRVRGDEG